MKVITSRLLSQLLMFFFALCITQQGQTQTPALAWARAYHARANGYDYARALAVDRSNNIIVAGRCDLGQGAQAFATIKYSPAGTPAWTNLHGSGYSELYAATVDRNENVIVTGWDWPYLGTVKYSPTGTPLWTNRYSAWAGDSSASAVAADVSNNIVVTGSSWIDYSHPCYATFKYSSAGLPLWTNLFPAQGAAAATALVIDRSNAVVVTGSYYTGASVDYATVKYTSAGTPLWTNYYDGPGNGTDHPTAIALDANDNIIVTGSSPTTNLSVYTDDYATIKYSSVGVPLWTNRYNGTGNGIDQPCGIAVDGSNNVIVAGTSPGETNGQDYLAIKYSPQGAPLWTNRYNGLANLDDYAVGVVADKDGNTYVAGQSSSVPGTSDYVWLIYSPAGVPLWTNTYSPVPGITLKQATAVLLDANKDLIMTGYGKNLATYPAFVTVKYAASVPAPVLTALGLTNGAFRLRADGLLESCTLVVQGSTNLTRWIPVFTNTTPTNVATFTDTSAAGYPKRFYRAFQFP